MARETSLVHRSMSAVKAFFGSTPGILIVLMSALFVMAVVLLVPFTREVSADEALEFSTEQKNENSLELGIEKVAREGKEGTIHKKYKYTQTIFSYFFQKDNVEIEEVGSKIVSKSTSKVVLMGTRKWQYMMCSNGTYRYYTDEQFKSPKVGFISKSPDYCAQNNQGKMTRLADTSSGVSNYTRPSYVPPKCSIIDIPYKTVYKDVDWLYVGETQDGYGSNGFKYVCSDGTMNNSYAPYDKTIYRGTKVKQSNPTYADTPTVPTQDYAAKSRCDGEYSRARAQLSMYNATDSSAMVNVQRLYAQCLSRAGF